MKIVVLGRSPSWNKIYQGGSWYTRKATADSVHQNVHDTLLEMGYRVQQRSNYFKKKVTIDVVGFFNKRPLDSDNIPAKLYIDGLKDFLLSNDAMAQVGRVTTESKVDKGHERVEITIHEQV